MENIQEISTDLIIDPKDAMRSELDHESLFDLADDIKKNGLIQPITVRPVSFCAEHEKDCQGLNEVVEYCKIIQRYEVVAGHRRLCACKIAGKIKIQCVVRDIDDTAAFSIMASENLVREDVDPVDEAEFLNKIITRTGKTPSEVAATIRKSIQYVNDRLIVATMPDYLKDFLRAGQIKLGAALALNQITDEDKKRIWVGMAVRDGINVRVAEYWLTQWKMSQLPDSVIVDTPSSEIGEPTFRPVLFRCAVDGKEYPASDTVMVSVFKGNLPLLSAISSELNHPPPQEEKKE